MFDWSEIERYGHTFQHRLRAVIAARCEGQECLRLSGLPSTGRAPPFRPEEGSE